ncbi:MAG: hypothetical protein ABIE22_04655 [archaeon]
MRRGIAVLILALILASFVIADTEEDLRVAASGAGETMGSGVNELLNQEVMIPDWLDGITKFLLDIQDDGPLDMQTFIVMLAIFIALFIVIHNSLGFIDIVKGDYLPWILSLIVTLIVAITGSVRIMAFLFLNLGDLFGLTDKFGWLNFLVAIIIAGILLWGADVIIRMLKGKFMLESAEVEGFEAGQGLKILKSFRRYR